MARKNCSIKTTIVLTAEEKNKFVSFFNILIAIERRTAKKVKSRSAKKVKAKSDEDMARVKASFIYYEDMHNYLALC